MLTARQQNDVYIEEPEDGGRYNRFVGLQKQVLHPMVQHWVFVMSPIKTSHQPVPQVEVLNSQSHQSPRVALAKQNYSLCNILFGQCGIV